MDKEAAGVGGLLADLARSAAKKTWSAAPALAARARPALGATLAAARPAVGSAVGSAMSAARPVANAVVAAPARAAATAKFVAGVPASAPFAPNLRGAVGNAARAAFRPRYPGLDRPPGVASMARPFDRTRAFAGGALRNGGLGTLGLSGAAAADAAFRTYPRYAADYLSIAAGLPREQWPAVRERAVADAPRYYAELGRQAVGLGDRSPFSRLHGDVARGVALPLLRNDLYESRRRRPWLFGATDALRSTTPAGLLATAGIRALGSPEPPDFGGAVAAGLKGRAAEFLRSPAAFSGPFADVYRDVLPASAVRAGDARNSSGDSAYFAGVAPPDAVRKIRGDYGSGWLPGVRPTWGHVGQAIPAAAAMLRHR